MPTFLAARDALLANDLAELERLLSADPGLVHQRHDGIAVPYNGYFFAATLLHHVAGNPTIRDVPPDGVPLARLLLRYGAEVNALTRAGPDQPTDIGWTTLGLVATSGLPGAMALMDVLLEAGADVDAPNGGALRGALYYHQRDCAAALVAHGARVDLACAAGLGRLDLIEAMLAHGVEALPTLPRLAHYSQVPLPEPVRGEDLMAVALAMAAQHGQVAVIERLLATGIAVDVRPHYDHRGTAMHYAALGDQPAAITVLLRHGADPTLTDATYASTPAGWARHMGRVAALAALPNRE